MAGFLLVDLPVKISFHNMFLMRFLYIFGLVIISIMLLRFKDALQCPSCGAGLQSNEKNFSCVGCARAYEISGKSLVFLKSRGEFSGENNFTFKIKSFLKKHPKFFFLLYYSLGCFVGKTAKQAIKDLPKDSFIVNVASGIKTVREDVINLDFESFPNVDVVADAGHLPFKDNFLDAVICESSLEHFKNPEIVVKEMHRVLKPGGLVYVSAPFICGFHASPDDYYRWTSNGLKQFLGIFKEKEFGVGWGPTYALTTVLREWISLVISFNSIFIQQTVSIFLMIVFAPFNFLDYIFGKFGSAEIIAYGFYFIGIKK